MQIPAAFFSGEEALMPYAHQDALQRVCAEVERVVWPIDRDFAEKGRRYWIRPAEDIEVSERELMDMAAAPPLPSGWCVYVVVKVLSPGVRMRSRSLRRTSATGGATCPKCDVTICTTTGWPSSGGRGHC